MMGIRRWLLALLPLLFAFSAEAQEQTLQKAKRYLDASKGLQIEYQLTIGEDSEQGSYYALGEDFCLESPSIRAWHQGGNLWVFIPQNGEVNLTQPYKEDLLELNPLLNLNRISAKTFNLKESTTGAVTTIKATPKQKEEIEWLEVHLNSQCEPLSMRVKQRSISVPIVLKVTKLRQSATAQMKQKGFFRFDANKLPGVAVIDLR